VIVASDASELAGVVTSSGGAADALVVKPAVREELRRTIEGTIQRERVRRA